MASIPCPHTSHGRDQGTDAHGDLDLVAVGPSGGQFEAPDYGITFSRTLLFATATYRFGAWRVGAELGRLTGDPGEDLLADFAGGDAAKTYLSVGVRLGNR